jgi:hypothetical protein
MIMFMTRLRKGWCIEHEQLSRQNWPGACLIFIVSVYRFDNHGYLMWKGQKPNE